jgi:cell wall-associated NlpC family hydrolase
VPADRMRTCTPGRHREHPILERPAGRAAVVAAVTAALLPVFAPVVEAAPDPVGPGHFDRADLRALMTARADRAIRPGRGLYLDPPRHPAPLAVQVAVAPPQPAPAPVVPVKVYAPKHATTVKQVRARRAVNVGKYYAPPVGGSGGAAAAISYALAQRGDPYVFGATGPSAFDCSGLVGAAWRAAGVSLPRTAAQISSRGTAVPRDQWQPGDILYWGGRGSAYHVALYLGGGMLVEAAHPGTTVRVVSVWGSPGAVRV